MYQALPRLVKEPEYKEQLENELGVANERKAQTLHELNNELASPEKLKEKEAQAKALISKLAAERREKRNKEKLKLQQQSMQREEDEKKKLEEKEQ